MKMIRNLAIHESIREAFLDFIDPIARQVHTCQDDDLLVEVVGILASLSIPDVSLGGGGWVGTNNPDTA